LGVETYSWTGLHELMSWEAVSNGEGVEIARQIELEFDPAGLRL